MRELCLSAGLQFAEEEKYSEIFFNPEIVFNRGKTFVSSAVCNCYPLDKKHTDVSKHNHKTQRGKQSITAAENECRCK